MFEFSEKCNYLMPAHFGGYEGKPLSAEFGSGPYHPGPQRAPRQRIPGLLDHPEEQCSEKRSGQGTALMGGKSCEKF
jgi:hypothetical protein